MEVTDLVAISWFLNKTEHAQAICSGTLIPTFTCTAGKSFPWSSAPGLASSRLSTAADTCSPSALRLVSLWGCWPWEQHQQPAHWGAFQGHRQNTCRQGQEWQGLWALLPVWGPLLAALQQQGGVGVRSGILQSLGPSGAEFLSFNGSSEKLFFPRLKYSPKTPGLDFG